ncbi:MAG: pitrilysin family protein [Patescibacteria group bacterium]
MSKLYQKFTFKNGLRLVTVPMKNTQAVTVLVLVGTGSKYETKGINGISHFLEHMLFKGTKKRPTSLDVSLVLDKIGGENNAFTDREQTGYYAKVDAKHLDTAIDWISDIFLNSKFDSREIEKEKGVIIEEINMYLDEPRRYVGTLWNKLLYGDQPAGWDIAGTEETIKNIKRNDFINYLKNHYSASNTVMVVAGKIDNLNKLKKDIENRFKTTNHKKSQDRLGVVFSQNKPQKLIHFKKTDQAHLCLGVRSYNIFHKDIYVLNVLTSILSGGFSSRMLIEIREKRGLAYYVGTSNYSNLDNGCLVTRAGVNNSKADEATIEILKQYKLIKNKKVSAQELRKAKDYIKGRAILGMESSDDWASFYGDQELFENKILTLEEKLAKIEAVTAEDVQRVAKDIFKPEKLNLALIGPFKNKKRFQNLLDL